ncbi:putative inorganic phosphate cotransporter [Daktulosphaira vitifoliae]|uniref:putative inorganic phosphate cotransporter n=1 Tax=Daktulosphaira vitifoliae TaxID=58002 RepID=UPI0021A9B06D|nr:putative inorganic phosphate cotransporter [Daktulosphaira vitifoliae]
MPSNKEKCSFWQQRYLISILGFVALAISYVQRFCLSLAITEMADGHHQHSLKNSSQICKSEIQKSGNLSVSIEKDLEFDWDEKTQGLILASFFWGYVITQIPGGMWADKYGGKITVALGVMFSSLGSLLTPYVARIYGPTALVVLRLLIGLAQGPLYPSLNRLLASWVPIEERGRLGSLVFAGAQVGNVLSMQMGGFLMRYFDTWTSVFYIFGSLGFFWLMFWLLIAYNHPNHHPFIGSKEKRYLSEAIHTHDPEDMEKLEIPWKEIFKSRPVWGLIIIHIGHDWGLFAMITDLPKYMKSVLGFSVAQNGLLSGLPYILMWLVAIGSGFMVDSLIASKRYSITLIRKIFVTIASVGPAVGIVLASYSGCDKMWAVFSFTLGMGLMGTFVPSLKVNALDLSPNFAGTLLAIVGTIGCLSGTMAPYIVGLMVPNSSLEEWRSVFWLSAAILVITNVVFIELGSAKVQPWNETKKRKYDEENDFKNFTPILKPL